MTSLKELKTHLRQEALGRRDALDAGWRIEASLRMAGHAGAIDLTHGPVLSGFMPIRSEVDLRPSLAALADPQLYSRDPAEFARLTEALARARAGKDAAEERWLELAARVEG